MKLEEQRLKVGETQLTYVEAGQGQPVVFVHGACGDWRTWAAMGALVAPFYRFIAMSRRYHHPNDWSDDGRQYNAEQHVEDLVGFIRSMGAGQVHLVGTSYGGRLAGVLAIRYPELLRSVVLGEPSLVAPTDPGGKQALAEFSEGMRRVAEIAKTGKAREAAILLFNTVNAPVTFAHVSAERQKNWLDNQNTVAPMFSDSVGIPVSCAELSALKVPALVVGGEKSRANFRLGNAALVACLPTGTESIQVPGAPHSWAAHDPQFAARVVMEFLAKH